MFTFTMTNKENGVSVTSQEMTKEMAEKTVANMKKHDVKNQIEFVINAPEVNETEIEIAVIVKKIEAIQTAPESKEGAKGFYIYNPSALKKMEALTWQMYWITSAQRTVNPPADASLKFW